MQNSLQNLTLGEKFVCHIHTYVCRRQKTENRLPKLEGLPQILESHKTRIF